MTCFRHAGCLPPLMLALLAAAPASAQGRGGPQGPTLEDVYQKGTDASLFHCPGLDRRLEIGPFAPSAGVA